MAKSDRDVIAEAREFQRMAMDHESQNRLNAEEELRFAMGDQWSEEDLRDRSMPGNARPSLVINRLLPASLQVTNDFSLNRPSINVGPVDMSGDDDVADVVQGLVRSIEIASNADEAYDVALTHSTLIGLGYVRIVSQYVSDDSFDVEPRILPVVRPWSVYFDSKSTAIDGADAMGCLVSELLTKKEFERMYPRANPASYYPEGTGDSNERWITDEMVRVAEYFCIEFAPKTLVELNTGAVMWEDDLPSPMPKGLTVERTRKSHKRTVEWYKLTGAEVLEQATLPGRWIPVIPFYGLRWFLPNETVYSGMVRSGRDPQRMLNYWKSAETEHIALTPRVPYIAAAGQVEKYKREWQMANRANLPILRYDPVALNGTLVPPPQRQSLLGPDLAITQATLGAVDDIKATTGIFDASLGARSNETSGVAIRQRQQEGSTGNFHYTRNARMSIRHIGRILVDWIPSMYSGDRAVRIIGEDMRQKVVRLSEMGEPSGKAKDGKTPLYNLSIGRYDVTIAAGPSYTTRRQEAVEGMLGLAQANPRIWEVAGPQMVRQMDWPGAEEIAEALERGQPPELRAPQEGDDPKAQVQQLSAQLQQATQQLQSLNAYAEQREQLLEELQSKVTIMDIAAKNREQDLALKAQEVEGRQEIEAQKLALEALRFQWEQLKDEMAARQGLLTLQGELQGDDEEETREEE